MIDLDFYGIASSADTEFKRDLLQAQFTEMQRVTGSAVPEALWQAVGLLMERSHMLGLLEYLGTAKADLHATVAEITRRLDGGTNGP